MLEDYLEIVFVFSCEVVDVELVGVVSEILIVSIVLFLWLDGVLGRIIVLGFVLFEIVGVVTWIVL